MRCRWGNSIFIVSLIRHNRDRLNEWPREAIRMIGCNHAWEWLASDLNEARLKMGGREWSVNEKHHRWKHFWPFRVEIRYGGCWKRWNFNEIKVQSFVGKLKSNFKLFRQYFGFSSSLEVWTLHNSFKIHFNVKNKLSTFAWWKRVQVNFPIFINFRESKDWKVVITEISASLITSCAFTNCQPIYAPTLLSIITSICSRGIQLRQKSCKCEWGRIYVRSIRSVF